MKRRSHAKRRDANEPEIMKALLAVGATVERLDVVDLLVGYKGVNYLIEVKTPEGRNKVTEKQRELIDKWGGQYEFATNPTQALIIIGAVEEEAFNVN